jgi:4-amino-4-deoxy-L-arabinose transferase-like glycosyltransferase
MTASGHPAHRDGAFAALTRCAIVALIVLTFAWGLGALPFYTKGEPREALVVWDMVHGGSWILPLRNGTEIPSKPPLFHWFGALASMATSGASEFSIRLPSAVFGLLGVALTFVAGTQAWGVRAGWVAALALATSFEWIRAGTTARVDMTLTFFMVAALVVIWRLDRAATRSTPRTILLATLLALATLAKGPVGAILPLLTAGVYMAVQRDATLLRKARPLLGLVLLIAIAGSWYALAVHEGGEAFVTKQLLQENILRFFDTERGGRGHEHSAFYLLPALLGGMTPWSLFFPAVGFLIVRRRRHLADDDLLFPLVWLLTIVVFYSLSSGKRSVYLLPAYPAAALLLGAWWTQARAVREAGAVATRLARGAAYLCAALLGVVALALGGLAVGLTPVALLERVLDPRDAANLALLDIIAAGARPLLVASALALATLAAASLSAVRHHQWAPLCDRIATGIATGILVVQIVYHPALARAHTFKPFMARVRATVEEAPLFFYDTFDYGVVYYAHRHVAWWHGARSGPSTPAPVFLLMLQTDWKALPPATRASLPVVDRSRGTGPKGDRRLVLVRATRIGAAALAIRTRDRPHPRHVAAISSGHRVSARASP